MCPKPVVALTGGVVMGGGIGLAGHARFRVATAGAKFAMPEGAIGFFPDVGVNAILAKAPRARALAFLMTGMTVSAADAFALGLTDCIVPEGTFGALREELFLAIAEGDVQTSIVAVMQAHAIDAGVASFVQAADRLEGIFSGGDPAAMIAALEDMAGKDVAARDWFETIKTRCPTSLAVAALAQIAAREQGDISRVLATDLKLARMMAGRPDFVEGVRAILVDKDRNARWQPARMADVALAEIRSRL